MAWTPLSTLALLALAIVLVRAMESGLRRFQVPALLLELVAGFLIARWVAAPEQLVSIFGASELGVLILFFLVGLEMDLVQMGRRIGTLLALSILSLLSSGGIFLLLESSFGLPDTERWVVVAILSTSGTGMALRVLRDRQAVASEEGRFILGTSLLVDLPAILVLAWILPKGRASVSEVWPWGAGLVLMAVLVAMRSRLIRVQGLGLVLPLLILGAWSSEIMGLTALPGAIAVGWCARASKQNGWEDRLEPLANFLIPLYFLTVGMQIPSGPLMDPSAWGLGLGLFAVAILGRALCTLPLLAKGRKGQVMPWTVAWGLVPRGLPGLVFTTMAFKSGILTEKSFFGLVVMVTLTNLAGVVGLAWSLEPSPRKKMGD